MPVHSYTHTHTNMNTCIRHHQPRKKKARKGTGTKKQKNGRKHKNPHSWANTSSPLQLRLTEHLLCTHWALSLPREGDRSVAEPVPPISGPGLGKQHTHPHPCTPTDALGKVGAEKGTALGGHRHSGGCHPQRLSPHVKRHSRAAAKGSVEGWGGWGADMNFHQQETNWNPWP